MQLAGMIMFLLHRSQPDSSFCLTSQIPVFQDEVHFQAQTTITKECDDLKLINTDRLFLREMTPDDGRALFQVLGDPETMWHYPYTFDGQHVKDWIERNMNRYRKDGFGLWAVCLNDTGEMIGDCGLTLQSINGKLLPEIGYHIHRDCQRKGYAKEAAKAVRDWAFRNRIIRPCTPTANIPMYLPSGLRNPSGCVLPANIRMKSTEKRMYP